MGSKSLIAAIIQYGPEYFDKKKTVEKAVELARKAAQSGANYLVFGETWLSGYPAWLDVSPGAALWDSVATKEVFARLRANCVVVGGAVTDALGAVAREHGIVLVIGVLSLSVIVLVRRRSLPTTQVRDDAEQLPDAWAEAGRRLKE